MLVVGFLVTTLQVGPGKPYPTPCAAIAAAGPGDTIEVDAGSYDGDTCAWATDGLTIRGVGGRARIDLTGVTPAQQKGIFTILAPSATIERFELSGAALSQVAGNNGAGIRHQGTDLTVRDCYFHDNQNGILGSPSVDGQGTVLIENSEFAANGAGDGFSHNMYLGPYAQLVLRGSYSHGAKVGHLVKSRARQNLFAYNRITDEDGTTASYEIDLPNGGRSILIGNLIHQAATSQNPTIITSGEEGATNPQQQVYVVHNTIVNDRASGTFVSLAAGTTGIVANNVFRGPGGLALAGATADANWDDGRGDPMLVAPGAFDYRLDAGSPCVNAGAALDPSLVPDAQYLHPAQTEPRAVAGPAIDIGAYEVASAPGNPDAGVTSPDAGATGADAGTMARPDAGGDPGVVSGSGCAVDGGGAGWLLALAALVRVRGRSPAAGRPSRRRSRRG